MKRQRGKLLQQAAAIFLSLCLSVSGTPMQALASELPDPDTEGTTASACNHVHDETCGYAAAVPDVEPVQEQPCNHVHDENCGGLVPEEEEIETERTVSASVMLLEAEDISFDRCITSSDQAGYVKVNGTETSVSNLSSGNYYLGGDVTVNDSTEIAIAAEAEVRLNLNGYTLDCYRITVSNSNAKLHIYDSSTEHTGKISVDSFYGVYLYNSGAEVYLHGGSVENTCRRGYGIYVYSGKLYLGAAKAVTGDEAGIYINNYYSSSDAVLYGHIEEVYYGGAEILLALDVYDSGKTTVMEAVPAGNSDTSHKFVLKNSNYKLVADEGNLKVKGIELTLNWYGDDGTTPLNGEDYPTSIEYNTYLTALPAGREQQGKTFVGWKYRTAGTESWSSDIIFTSKKITSGMDFKEYYVESFAGAGTENDPYQIKEVSDLQKLAELVNNGYSTRGLHFKLMQSLDLSPVCGEGTGNWTPIGNSSYAFQGTFDGDNKTISNLYINGGSSSYQGLFGCLSGAAVKNLTLNSAKVVSASGYVGILAGTIYGGMVQDCTLAGGVSGPVNDFGAIAGSISGCRISNVDTEGVISGPYGYTIDVNRVMGYKKSSYYETMDILANYKWNWIQTTYDNGGYRLEKKDLSGATVTSHAEFVNGGQYLKLSYTVTAGSTGISDGMLGVHADTQIGDNDRAAIKVIKNRAGAVIGLSMVDTHTNDCKSKDAQFNLYFGGTGGATGVSTYWFGGYSYRQENCFSQIDQTNNYYRNYTEDYEADESGNVVSYPNNRDSGIAFSWQNINLAAGESATYSVILGVGEQSEPPAWSNGSMGSSPIRLTQPENGSGEESETKINVSASVSDEAGVTDTLYYSINNGDEQIVGSIEATGDLQTITGTIDLKEEIGETIPDGTYDIDFWIVNSKGAASESVRKTITITDGAITGGLDPAEGETQENVSVTSKTTGECTSYSNLEEAFAAAKDGDTITVLESYTDGSVAMLYVDPEGNPKNLVLNLNGKTVSMDDDAGGIVVGNGSLTVKGNGTYGGMVQQLGGTLRIENGTFGVLLVQDALGIEKTEIQSGTFLGITIEDEILDGQGILLLMAGNETETCKVAMLAMLAEGSRFDKEIKSEIYEENNESYVYGYCEGPVTVIKNKFQVSVTVDGATEVKVDSDKLSEVMDTVLTEEDKADGNTVMVELKIEDKTAEKPDKDIAGGILHSMNANTLGAFLDITLSKTVTPTGGTGTTSSITDTGESGLIPVTITIPVSMRGGSDYQVIRVHGEGSGKTAVALTTTYDEDANTLTFETNKFSTYVIAYTPAGSGSGGGGTGGSSGSSSSGGSGSSGSSSGGSSGGSGSSSKPVGGVIGPDGTFIKGTIDKNGYFVSDAPGADGKRIKGYVDENGYLIAGGNTKDSEPRTGEAAALPMASMAMVAGLSYLLDLFKERKRTLSEAVGEQKERIVSWIIRKAKYRHFMIRCLALGLIGLVLILYGAIQKVVQFDKREGQEET